MKKAFLATIALLGIASVHPVKSALFTHNLQYTPAPGDNSGTLTGQITFDSTQVDTNYGTGFNNLGMVAIDNDLIPFITFTYTPAGGDPQVLVTEDIEAFRLQHTNLGSTNYGASNIQAEFTAMQFYTSIGEFNLDASDDFFALQAADDDDFDLQSTTYHSPGPLPLFGLLTAFSSIKKLKSKYKRKYSM